MIMLNLLLDVWITIQMFGEEFPQSRILSFWDVGGLLKMRKGLGFGEWKM